MDKLDALRKVADSTSELEGLYKRKAELMHQLNRANLIKILWPQAFDLNKAEMYWSGIVHKPRSEHRYFIVRPDGEKRSFPYNEVPELLGGGLK